MSLEGHVADKLYQERAPRVDLELTSRGYFYQAQAAHINLPQHLAPSVGPSILIYPKERGMVDSQPVEEEFQGAMTRDVGTNTYGWPTEPQAKMKATPRKLAYDDFDKEPPTGSLAKGFSDRFSLESFSTSDTRRQTRSTIKSQKTPSKNKESTHLKRLRRESIRSCVPQRLCMVMVIRNLSRSSMTKYPKWWSKCLKGSEPSLGEKWLLGRQKWYVLLKGSKDTFVRHGSKDLKEAKIDEAQGKHEGIWGCTLLIPEKTLSPRLPRLRKKSSPWIANPGRNGVKVVNMIRQEGTRKRSFEERRFSVMSKVTFPTILRSQLIDEPVILEGIKEENQLRRILVDGGSSSEIMGNISSLRSNRSSSNFRKGRKKQDGANGVSNNKMSVVIQNHNRKDQNKKPLSGFYHPLHDQIPH
nr:hypothetical protein [Tanacetum cinerariifolium]